MIARIRKAMDNKEQGFTLIELLVVIIIIGILAAIAIPAFLNQRQKAWVSQAESDLKNAAIAAESFATANNGSYATMTVAGLDADEGFNPTTGVTITLNPAPTATEFTMVATHANLAGRTFTYNSGTGAILDSADTP